MIVEWKKDTVKVIPAKLSTDLDPTTSTMQVVLPPGYSEVQDSVWKIARLYVSEEIANGSLLEEWTKVAKEEIPASQSPEIYLTAPDGSKNMIKIPAKLSDINRPRVFDVVKGCLHTKTLMKWKDEEKMRQDVSNLLEKQIQGIESGEILG